MIVGKNVCWIPCSVLLLGHYVEGEIHRDRAGCRGIQYCSFTASLASLLLFPNRFSVLK